MHLFEACPKIYFGENALDYLDGLPREKVLLVTDPFMVSSGAVKAVTGRLDRLGLEYAVFSQVEPDPSIETIAAGLQQIFHEKPDIVIALGGGSAIDATKAMLYFCTRFKGIMMGRQHIHQPMFIAIPTTSGTGSEVTSYAVVSDRQRNVKIPLSHRSMTPEVAILDPEFTKTLPADMVAYTGMDVLTHAVEAYVSGKANDFTDLFARDAAEKVLRYLPVLYADVSNVAPREKMFSASTMAGLAFTNSSLGLCHGIAHTIGAEFHLPHGKANAIILPYIIAFNAGLGRKAATGLVGRYADLARSIGVGAPDDGESCGRLVCTVQVLCERFGIPGSFEAAGIDRAAFRQRQEACVRKILEDACTKANPAPVTARDISELLEAIFDGRLEVGT